MLPIDSSILKISEAPIAIFGEVLADIFPTQRILGGAPFNVARHLKAFGLQSVMISSIGLDETGDALMDEMHRLEMDTSGMQFDATYPTGQVKVTLNHQTHQFEILPEQAYDHINATICHETIAMLSPVLAYFGSLALRGVESRLTAEQFLADCAKIKCPTFLDINLRAPWYQQETLAFCLSHADYVKVNNEELAELAIIFALNAKTTTEQAFALKQQFNFKGLYVTCGAQGAWVIDESMKLHTTEPILSDDAFIDSVGAGDAFSAVCMMGLICEWPVALTLKRANQFAASVCRVAGAAPASLSHYQPFLQAWK